MNQLFHPQLLNQPFGDPTLYIELRGEGRALFFDLGEIAYLKAGKLVKVSHVFISHTHMDHFIGFDHLLRLHLAREKTLHIYGPQGIIKNVRGKLNGYTWNLVAEYPFVLAVSEIRTRTIHRVEFICKNGFKSRTLKPLAFDGIADNNPHYTVRALHLDHKIPSLAYCLEERFHVNINKDRLQKLGLPVGPWLRDLKNALWEGKPDSHKVKVYEGTSKKAMQKISLGKLKEQITSLNKGQKIVYVSDCRGTEENYKKIVSFAMNADILFCEGSFLAKDRIKAEERGHLTAEQAGLIAREAGVKALHIYHFSPRYEGYPEVLYAEAERAFRG
jgi:ribonuclease Z